MASQFFYFHKMQSFIFIALLFLQRSSKNNLQLISYSSRDFRDAEVLQVERWKKWTINRYM